MHYPVIYATKGLESLAHVCSLPCAARVHCCDPNATSGCFVTRRAGALELSVQLFAKLPRHKRYLHSVHIAQNSLAMAGTVAGTRRLYSEWHWNILRARIMASSLLSLRFWSTPYVLGLLACGLLYRCTRDMTVGKVLVMTQGVYHNTTSSIQVSSPPECRIPGPGSVEFGEWPNLRFNIDGFEI